MSESKIAETTSPKLYRQEELARLLGLSVRTLANWRWLRKGPPYVKIEKKIFYPGEALDEWVRLRIIYGRNFDSVGYFDSEKN